MGLYLTVVAIYIYICTPQVLLKKKYAIFIRSLFFFFFADIANLYKYVFKFIYIYANLYICVLLKNKVKFIVLQTT